MKFGEKMQLSRTIGALKEVKRFRIQAPFWGIRKGQMVYRSDTLRNTYEKTVNGRLVQVSIKTMLERELIPKKYVKTKYEIPKDSKPCPTAGTTVSGTAVSGQGIESWVRVDANTAEYRVFADESGRINLVREPSDSANANEAE